VEGWNNQNLRENRYPFCTRRCDCTQDPREDGRMRSRAAMMSMGINEEGYREILGIMLGDSESEAS